MASKFKTPKRKDLLLEHQLEILKKNKAKQLKKSFSKKLSAEELVNHIFIVNMRSNIIRPLKNFKAKSYNLDKQKEQLLYHLFVQYPIPRLLLKYFLDAKLNDIKNSSERAQTLMKAKEWFLCLAQGKSFPKLTKDTFTRKEASTFLQAPERLALKEGIMWAKLKTIGLIEKIINILIEELVNSNYGTTTQEFYYLASIIHNNEEQIDESTLREVLHFVRYKRNQDAQFSLKGRTLNSLINMSNEWHILMQKAKLGQLVKWEPLCPIWHYQKAKSPFIYEIVELVTNRELINEGRKQKHCVSSYVRLCLNGSTHIFSMRKYLVASFSEVDIENKECLLDKGMEWDNERLTIEIRNLNSCWLRGQVAGLQNRRPTNEELAVIREWELKNISYV